MTGDGSKCKVYKDGVLWGEAKTYKSISGTTIYINGWDTSTSYSASYLLMSDFRIYATALSAEDIATLYRTSAHVDKLGGIHSFKFIENQSAISTKKNGLIYSKELDEMSFSSNAKITKTNNYIGSRFIEK